MAERVLGTGVELRLPCDNWDEDTLRQVRGTSDGLVVEAQVFVDVEDDGRRFRVGGTTGLGAGMTVPTDADPTTALVQAAYETREMHLGDLLGHMRRGNCDVTRFEFYAAPFRIELADDLREALADAWKGRAPRPTADA